MPIYKQKYEGDEIKSAGEIQYTDDEQKFATESLCIHFGYGDIAISSGQEKGRPHADHLLFFQAPEKHGIGEYESEPYYEGRTFPPLRFVFDKIESIDVVIERLQTLKAEFPVSQNATA